MSYIFSALPSEIHVASDALAVFFRQNPDEASNLFYSELGKTHQCI